MPQKNYQKWHLQDFQGKCVAVLGLGVSGTSAMELLDRLGAQLVGVNQGDPEKWLPPLKNELKISWQNPERKPRFFAQEDSTLPEVLTEMDLIVLSPGIPRESSFLAQALESGVAVISEIELGALFLDEERVFTVTGTNGKTTTVSLLSHLMHELHIPHFLGGNIGTPLCEYIKKKLAGDGPRDAVILELSSFQLESTHCLKPFRSLLTNLSDNHGERYHRCEDYFKAKWRLAEMTFDNGGKVMAGLSLRSYLSSGELKAHRESLFFLTSSEVSAEKEGANIHSVFSWLQFLQVRSDLFPLPGNHNRENLVFALWCLYEYLGEKEWELSLSLILGALATFRGVEHRLEYLPTQRSFDIFNDAKSTNFQATLAAVQALKEKRKPVWLILGGQPRDNEQEEREQDFPARELKEHVERVFVFGQTRNELEKAFREREIPVESEQTLGELWQRIVQKDFHGILLFSPAFPSFDQFQNYRDRGRQFKALVYGESLSLQE